MRTRRCSQRPRRGVPRPSAKGSLMHRKVVAVWNARQAGSSNTPLVRLEMLTADRPCLSIARGPFDHYCSCYRRGHGLPNLPVELSRIIANINPKPQRRGNQESAMFDYRLEHVASRPAKVGDRLTTTRFKNPYMMFSRARPPTRASWAMNPPTLVGAGLGHQRALKAATRIRVHVTACVGFGRSQS
jgi:hypothetical protein